MQKNELFEKVVNILEGIIPNVSQKIDENTALIRDLEMDSMDFVNYITQVEMQFNIKISDDDIKKHELGIMKNMIEYLLKKTI
jgi:acyl carrier protein